MPAQAGENNDITSLLDLRRTTVSIAPAQNTLRLVDASNGTVYAFNNATKTWDLPLSVSLAATLNLTTADAAAAAAGIPLDIDVDIALTADTTLTAPLVNFCGGTINYGTHALTIPRAEGEFTPWVTGTAAGTLQILRADRLTLEAMGAVGDGVTPDTAAIQRAISALPPASTTSGSLAPAGGTIYASNAQYAIDDTIIFDRPVRLVGCGYTSNKDHTAATQFNKNFNGVGFQINNIVSLENLSLRGGTVHGGDGIQIASARVALTNVSVHAMGGNGIRGGSDTAMINVNCCQLVNVHVTGNGGSGLYLHDGDPIGGGGPNVNGWTVVGLFTANNGTPGIGGDGLRVGNANANTFTNIVSQTNVAYGVNCLQGSYNSFLGGDYDEVNGAGAIHFALTTPTNLVQFNAVLGGQINSGIMDDDPATTNSYFYRTVAGGLTRVELTRSNANYIWATASGSPGAQICMGVYPDVTSNANANIAISQIGGVTGVRVGKSGGKVGFFATTPVSLQTPAGNTSGGAAGSVNTVYRSTTFTGGTGSTAYTVGDIVAALKTYGLLTS